LFPTPAPSSGKPDGLGSRQMAPEIKRLARKRRKRCQNPANIIGIRERIGRSLKPKGHTTMFVFTVIVIWCIVGIQFYSKKTAKLAALPERVKEEMWAAEQAKKARNTVTFEAWDPGKAFRGDR
jgi:hypothetical protein